MISLKEFIHRTLVDVAQGVIDANKEMPPEIGPTFSLEVSMGGHVKYHRGIEFDISVTASEGSTEKAGFMVALAPIGGGARAEQAKQGETAHRIKFEVSFNRTVA